MKSSFDASAVAILLALLTAGGTAQTMVLGWGNRVFNSSWAQETSYVEIAAGTFHTVALRSDGSVVAWGDPGGGKCNVPVLPAGERFVQVAAGGHHTVGLVCPSGSCSPLALSITQDTSAGCGPIVVAVTGASPGNELYNLISLGCTNGTGPILGVGLDVLPQVYLPLGTHPLHVQATPLGGYYLSIPVSCSTPLSIEAVTVEIIPGTSTIVGVSPTTGCVNLSL